MSACLCEYRFLRRPDEGTRVTRTGVPAILGYPMRVLETNSRSSVREPAPAQQSHFCPRSHQASGGQLDSTSAKHPGGKNGGDAHTPTTIMGFWNFLSLSSALSYISGNLPVLVTAEALVSPDSSLLRWCICRARSQAENQNSPATHIGHRLQPTPTFPGCFKSWALPCPREL